MVDLEGFEPCTVVDSTQLTDSTKRQKRSKRQFEVHGGYTDCCPAALLIVFGGLLLVVLAELLPGFTAYGSVV